MKTTGQKRSKLNGVLLLAALLMFSACTESTPKKDSASQTSTNPVSNNTETTPTIVGPTGNQDPVDDTAVGFEEEVTYYDEADSSDEPTLPGTPVSMCGTLYRQFNNPQIFFNNENNQLYTLKEFSYDSVVFLRNIKFQKDSYSLCLEGYRDNQEIYLNTTSNVTEVAHPLKKYSSEDFAHEYCGQLAYVKNFSGQVSLNLQVSNVTYLVHTDSMTEALPGGIPTVQSSITTANSVEACLYSSKASYYNYNETFKPQIDLEAYDLGAINPETTN